MNAVFLFIVFVAFLATGWRQLAFVPAPPDAIPPMEALANAMVTTAGDAVTLAIGLIGVMTLFLGLMKVAETGGLLVVIAKTIRPLMVRAFPDVPPDHPAMGAMILNLSANALGLGNAATPFGIRAMQELDRINPHRGVASDAMVLFLAINTSSVTLLPTGVIALRAAAGSHDPAGVLPTTLFATVMSTVIAIIAAKLYRRFSPLPALPATASAPAYAETVTASEPVADDPGGEGNAVPVIPAEAATATYPGWVSALTMAGIAAAIPLTVVYGKAIAPWIIPGLMVAMLGFGALRRVRVYETFVDGARDGFQVAVRIIPYLVAILVAVGMLSLQRVTHFNNWNVGHAHIAVLGFSGFIAIGALWHVLPLAAKRKLYSNNLVNLQFGLVLFGLTGFFAVLTIAGLIQGGGWYNAEMLYRVLPEIPVYMGLRALLGVFIITGAVVGLYNLYMTLRHGKPYEPESLEGSL